MAFGVSMLLKSLGVNISDDDIKKLEVLIPQLPAKAQEIIAFNVSKWQHMDTRLEGLEKRLEAQVETLDALLSQLKRMGELIDVTRTDFRSAVVTSGGTDNSGASPGRTKPNGHGNGNTRRGN